MKVTLEERADEAEGIYQKLRASLDVLEIAMKSKGLDNITGVWNLVQSAKLEAEDLRKIMCWRSV